MTVANFPPEEMATLTQDRDNTRTMAGRIGIWNLGEVDG